MDTPIITAEKLTKSEALNSNIPYRQAVGSLNYLATCTRPDIAYAVNYVSRGMQNPTNLDWIAVKRIFRYLQGTRKTGIIYKKGGSNILSGFSDASYAPEASDRKSTSGYVFTMNGGAISWKSKRQPIISLSSMEAEYIALSTAAKEGMWLRKLENSILGKLDPITIQEDNQSTIT